MKIAISSGKGGTGKTFLSTNIAVTLAHMGKQVCYLDCDVEEPNGHLFLKPGISQQEDITLVSPASINPDTCTRCGQCAKVCHYNAIAVIKDKVLFFPELCHVCGACTLVCPENSIIEKEKKIGTVLHGKYKSIEIHYALLETAEGGMSPRLVRKVKESAQCDINIFDSPPGTACPVVETVKDVDLCILVTDPTPFGVNDLKLAVAMCREIGQEPAVVVNRAEYMNNDLKEYCRKAQIDILGEIPDDRKIAEAYSTGDIAIDTLPQYQALFRSITDKIITRARQKHPVKQISSHEPIIKEIPITETMPAPAGKPRELVIISGKGGTGKTSVAASFASLAQESIIADCDVDAADLHLILEPRIKQRGYFSGGVTAHIDPSRCVSCGDCMRQCRFNAIGIKNGIYQIDPIACEGCGVCDLVCQFSAIETAPAINGQWFTSQTRAGPMSHARLGAGCENSGRLVTLVRNKSAELSLSSKIDHCIIDGAPGTGCPVIASLTGAQYALIVTEPTVSGIHDMKRILEVTAHFGVPSGVVVNKYDLNRKMTEKIKETVVNYNARFLGTISYDKNVTRAQVEKLSIVEYKDSPATADIKIIWNRLKIVLEQ